MRPKFIVLFIVLITFSSANAQKTKPDSFQYKISLTTEKKEFVIGEPVMVNVRYFNGSNTDWKFYKPDSSSYNSIKYRNELWKVKDEWKGYSFNDSIFIYDNPKCAKCGFSIPILGGMALLKPNETYNFKTNILKNPELTYLFPGQYRVTYRDRFESISTDTIVFYMKLSTKSIDFMLDLLIGEQHNIENIRQAITILSVFYPDMKKYQYTLKDQAIVYPTEQFEANMSLIGDFSKFWNIKKNSEEIKQKIDLINNNLPKYFKVDKKKYKLLSGQNQ